MSETLVGILGLLTIVAIVVTLFKSKTQPAIAFIVWPSILALILSLFTGLSGVLRRQLETAAADQAETLLSEAAATAMDAAFSNDRYSEIVTISRADDGTITSVTSAPGALSALSAAFQTKLREALATGGKIAIPAGNLTGSAWRRRDRYQKRVPGGRDQPDPAPRDPRNGRDRDGPAAGAERDPGSQTILPRRRDGDRRTGAGRFSAAGRINQGNYKAARTRRGVR